MITSSMSAKDRSETVWLAAYTAALQGVCSGHLVPDNMDELNQFCEEAANKALASFLNNNPR